MKLFVTLRLVDSGCTQLSSHFNLSGETEHLKTLAFYQLDVILQLKFSLLASQEKKIIAKSLQLF
jgi:hypothetical protein